MKFCTWKKTVRGRLHWCVNGGQQRKNGERRSEVCKLWGGETGHASGWMRPRFLTTRWHCSSKAAWLIVGDREDKVGLPVPTNGVFTSAPSLWKCLNIPTKLIMAKSNEQLQSTANSSVFIFMKSILWNLTFSWTIKLLLSTKKKKPTLF